MNRLFVFCVLSLFVTAGLAIPDSGEARTKHRSRRLITYCTEHPERCERTVQLFCRILEHVEFPSEYCVAPDDSDEDQCPAPDPTPDPAPDPTPDPDPTPTPEIDHLLISEVFYDVDGVHGSESANEWLEIYNGTGVAVDLTGWSISDAASSDTLPDGVVISDGEYLLITNATSTSDFWSIPSGTTVVSLGSPLGNGLGNSGDVVLLKDPSEAMVDAVSWGSNIDAFDPAAPDVVEGHSLARADLSTDSDTASDWVDRETPTPGS